MIQRTGITNRLKKPLASFSSAIAVACSGGSDSMALVLLAQEWAKRKNVKLVALTVDHGLRPESAQEAATVGKWLKRHRIAHHVLRWEGKKPKANIQESAREARYALLTGYCKTHGIATLLVAHTLDDQAETFLLRLKRGSGVDGLAAMAESSQRDGIRLLRPLLGVPKAELIAYLENRNQPYISDPSNENMAYDRVKIRKLLPELAALGLTPQRLAKTAANMARAREYLQSQTESFLVEHAQLHDAGYAELERLPEAPEIALRVLATLLSRIGGHTVPPRLDELERLYERLRSPGFKSVTLGGCVFKEMTAGFLVFRELKAVELSLTLPKSKPVLWDSRFTLTTSRAGLSAGALTQAGWLELVKQFGLKNPFPDKRILYTLPALRDAAGNVISVPHLGINAERCGIAFLFSVDLL